VTVMKHRIVQWVLAVAAAVALSGAAAAGQQKDTGTVAGVVTRAAGPVAAARVVVSSGSDSKYTASSTTDREGRFTIAGAPVGPIGVKVYDAGNHVVAQARGTLTRGETLTLTVQVP